MSELASERVSQRVPGHDATPPARRRSTLVGNAGGLIGSRVVVAALGWAGTLLIARTLTVPEFGTFVLVFTVLGLMSVVTDMSLGRVVVGGLVDPDRDRARFAGAYILLRTALGLVGYGVAVGFTVLAGYPDSVVRAMALAGVVVVVATPSAAVNGIYEAHLRTGRVAVAEVLGRSAQLALTVAVVAAGGRLVWLIVPAIVAELVAIAWKLVPLRRVMPITWAVDGRLWRAMLVEAVPLSLGAALTTVTYRIDTVMLSMLADLDAVAVYGVAYKFVELLAFVPQALVTALLPLLVRHWPVDPDGFHRELRRAWTLLLVVMGLAVVEFLLFARPVLGLLYGAHYTVAATAARVVVASQLLAAVVVVGLTVLVALGRHRAYPWVALLGLALNVAANLVAIPRYSYEGAAVATLATDAFVLVLIGVLLHRADPDLPGPPWVRVGAAALGAGAAGWALGRVAPWPVAAAAVVPVYAGLLLAVRIAGPGGVRRLLAPTRAAAPGTPRSAAPGEPRPADHHHEEEER